MEEKMEQLRIALLQTESNMFCLMQQRNAIKNQLVALESMTVENKKTTEKTGGK